MQFTCCVFYGERYKGSWIIGATALQGNVQVCAEVRQAFCRYLDAYFTRRDIEETLNLMSPFITGFGTGPDEAAYTSQQTERLYRRDLEEVRSPMSYEILQESITCPADHVGVVCAELNIQTVIAGQQVRFNRVRLSVVFLRTDEEWKMIHMHISFPTSHHQAGEAFPTMELEERAKVLERLVESRTAELQEANKKLSQQLAEIRTLQGLLPICAKCKKIREDSGYWRQIEAYLMDHTDLVFSHGLCPTCLSLLYPDLGPPPDSLSNAQPY